MIVYITSDQSNSYFPANKPWHFKVHFNSPLVLKHKVKVALLEIQASANKSRTLFTTNQTLTLYCIFCSESILDGEKKNILRRISMTKMRKWDHTFTVPIYVTVTENAIYEFEIYIKDLKGNYASFLQDPVLITLHFQ